MEGAWCFTVLLDTNCARVAYALTILVAFSNKTNIAAACDCLTCMFNLYAAGG